MNRKFVQEMRALAEISGPDAPWERGLSPEEAADKLEAASKALGAIARKMEDLYDDAGTVLARLPEGLQRELVSAGGRLKGPTDKMRDAYKQFDALNQGVKSVQKLAIELDNVAYRQQKP